jgi:hypothetical protein
MDTQAQSLQWGKRVESCTITPSLTIGPPTQVAITLRAQKTELQKLPASAVFAPALVAGQSLPYRGFPYPAVLVWLAEPLASWPAAQAQELHQNLQPREGERYWQTGLAEPACLLVVYKTHLSRRLAHQRLSSCTGVISTNLATVAVGMPRHRPRAH